MDIEITDCEGLPDKCPTRVDEENFLASSTGPETSKLNKRFPKRLRTWSHVPSQKPSIISDVRNASDSADEPSLNTMTSPSATKDGLG